MKHYQTLEIQDKIFLSIYFRLLYKSKYREKTIINRLPFSRYLQLFFLIDFSRSIGVCLQQKDQVKKSTEQKHFYSHEKKRLFVCEQNEKNSNKRVEIENYLNES